ncbi:5'/3'-nucleotidase SurE [Sphingomonas sp.]|jgi:5'-nucleotidase|uniref:5'/3'-nucleotidase SurE n=1 Tax=Sphingomonas sp. TaxID=28214 RepID=UPI002EDA2025
MRILLTNDDGYHARGLQVLERLAARFSDDVWIVAPAEDQSGTGRSLTLTRPLRVRRHGDRRFAVTGTPTDAVMMALGELMVDHKPDLILSGVNRGANLAEDVLYSGTVSAAAEGALAGIRAIALSQRYAAGEGAAMTFDVAETWGERILRPLIDAPLAPRTLVNVNFPPRDVSGVRIVRQGLRDYGRVRMDRRDDPRGNAYYWLAMGSIDHVPVAGTDLHAAADDHIAITPLHLDLTHDASMAMLTQAFSGEA